MNIQNVWPLIFLFHLEKDLVRMYSKKLGFLDYFGHISKAIWKRKSPGKVLFTSDCMSKFKVILLSYQQKTFGFSLSSRKDLVHTFSKKLGFLDYFGDISKAIWEQKSRRQVLFTCGYMSEFKVILWSYQRSRAP